MQFAHKCILSFANVRDNIFLMLFRFQKRKSAAQTTGKIRAVYGDNTLLQNLPFGSAL